jgi:hypothetical protein
MGAGIEGRKPFFPIPVNHTERVVTAKRKSHLTNDKKGTPK